MATMSRLSAASMFRRALQRQPASTCAAIFPTKWSRIPFLESSKRWITTEQMCQQRTNITTTIGSRRNGLRLSTAYPHIYQIPKKGTGFDHFLRKDSSEKNSSEESGNSSENADRGGGSGGGGGGGGGGSSSGFLWTAAALLGVVAYMASSSSSEHDQHHQDDHGSGGPHNPMFPREISWHDFLRLLQQRDVVKILIDPNVDRERPIAKVYVKPNAMGFSNNNTNSSGFNDETTTSGAGGGSSNGPADDAQRGRHQAHPPPQDEMHHGVTAAPGGGGADEMTISTSHNNNNTMTSHAAASTSSLFYYRLPIGNTESFERKLEEAQRAFGWNALHDVPVQYASDRAMGREVLATLPGLFLAAALYGLIRFASSGGGRMMGGGGSGGGSGGGGGMGGIFQIGKSTHKKINKQDISITFADVAGCDQAKAEIMEFVDFLKDSERFTKLGAKIPKGALLCGPPGTGKTLLAKAVAGESGVPFYSISGSDFIEMFVGVGPSRVRDLFNEARQNAPCIVFIDEIDAVGRQRGRGGVGGNDERENTLNQLLVEMDGFEPSTGVVVLAGTNRVDILDQALTRPGRFDRQITIDKPDLKGRKAIFEVHLKGIKLHDDMDDVAGRLAGLTPGFAGADIANICNEAAIVAARRQAESVTLDDFEKATDRIIGGLESNKIMSKEERSIVAHHEAGHAIAGWFLEHADPLLKVTIIPRSSGALGFAQYLPKEVFLRTNDQIMDIVCMTLAGRAAEEIFFGRVTTGASDDLKRVTSIVYSTIQLYGMNNRLGQLSFPKDPNAFFEDRPYSEKTAKAMDEEARSIVTGAYERTLNLLREKKSEVEAVANMLLEKETITHDDIVGVIGPRPFTGDPAYEEFIRRRKKDKEEHGDLVEKGKAEENAGASSEEEIGPLNPGLA